MQCTNIKFTSTAHNTSEIVKKSKRRTYESDINIPYALVQFTVNSVEIQYKSDFVFSFCGAIAKYCHILPFFID